MFSLSRRRHVSGTGSISRWSVMVALGKIFMSWFSIWSDIVWASFKEISFSRKTIWLSINTSSPDMRVLRKWYHSSDGWFWKRDSIFCTSSSGSDWSRSIETPLQIIFELLTSIQRPMMIPSTASIHHNEEKNIFKQRALRIPTFIKRSEV